MGMLQAHFLLGGMAGFFWRDDLKVIISTGKTPVWLLPQGPVSLAALKQGRGRELKGCVGKDVTNLCRIPTPLPSLRQWNQTGLSGVCSQGPNQFCLLTQFKECVWFLELYCHLSVLYLPS